MASMQVPVQRDKATEEVQQKETEHLLLSGVRNLAISDDDLTKQEQQQILDATIQVQNNSDEATTAGEELCGVGKELDGLIEEFKFAEDFTDGMFDEDKETLMDRILKFFQDLIPQLVKKGPSKAIVMVLIMVGYALIKRYLRQYINENILIFIETIAPVIYKAFLESGILDWIMRNGGWGKLKSFRIKAKWAYPIALGAGLIGVVIYHIMRV